MNNHIFIGQYLHMWSFCFPDGYYYHLTQHDLLLIRTYLHFGPGGVPAVLLRRCHGTVVLHCNCTGAGFSYSSTWFDALRHSPEHKSSVMVIPFVVAGFIILIIAFCVMCYVSLQEAFNSPESSLLQASNRADTYYQYGNNHIHSNQGAYTPLSSSKGQPASAKSNESIRQYFFYFLAFSAGARGFGIFMEFTFYIISMNYSQININLKLNLLFRLIPTLVYLTMYSLVAAFLCYLYYTCKGLQFFQIRFFWLVSNVVLYVVLISLNLIHPVEILSYWILSFSNLCIFVFICWSSYCVQELVSATPSISYPVTKISHRLIVLVYACLGALCINCVYYFLLAIQTIGIVYTFSDTNQIKSDILLYVISDGIPTSMILLAIGKNNYVYFQPKINYAQQQRVV